MCFVSLSVLILLVRTWLNWHAYLLTPNVESNAENCHVTTVLLFHFWWNNSPSTSPSSVSSPSLYRLILTVFLLCLLIVDLFSLSFPIFVILGLRSFSVYSKHNVNGVLSRLPFVSIAASAVYRFYLANGYLFTGSIILL